MAQRCLSAVLLLILLAAPVVSRAEDPVALTYDRPALEAKWRARIESFLGRGVIPIIDVESSLRRGDGDSYLTESPPVMDELGVALIAFDGYQAPRDGRTPGYRWGYTIHRVINAHPDRFVLASNGGTNRNWFRQREGENSFVAQTEQHIRSGAYPLIGEIEFRHYPSNGQCREGRDDRDINVPLDGGPGRRLFALAAETGVPLLVHLEPEDAVIPVLEKMLAAYPGARLIVAHFGQIRHPDRETRFGPALVRDLLRRFPNLYYDISVGAPGRTYRCSGEQDTVLWQSGFLGRQTDDLKPDYKAIFTEFSDRFVAGLDYGGERPPLPEFLTRRAANIRLILRDLPAPVQHVIAWRNAWRLLTGKDWKDAAPVPRR